MGIEKYSDKQCNDKVPINITSGGCGHIYIINKEEMLCHVLHKQTAQYEEHLVKPLSVNDSLMNTKTLVSRSTAS